MGRKIALGVAAWLLVGCAGAASDQGGAGAAMSLGTVAPQSVPASMQGVEARQLFGKVPEGSTQPAEPFGGYARGCIAGAVQLAETGPTWQAMRLSRNRNWGHPDTIDFVERLSRFAATQPGWEGLYVGDISQPRGGPMLSGHRSHQNGMDVDIWMLPPKRLDLTRSERESISSISLRRAGGAYTNDNWSRQHFEILRAAAKDPRMERIFIFPGAKVAMCDMETGDRSWLRKIRPWWGHHYHFHVRLNCPAGARHCEAQDPIPPGDGCAEAREWVRNILHPPPPDPDAPPPTPRRELRMTDLPGQCVSVLQSP